MVLRDVLTLVAVGLAVSVPLVLGMGKVVEDFLYGVKPADPWGLASAIAILSASAILAAYGPARKASKIDPVAALRNE